ncbi:MAG: response regulator [Pseudomonadales bacterium]|nr:response regulator [Pseudomonadales bacterium]MBO6565952.1 response regulator [Pseudomonadales bacterium]MBO6595632.1 response regulator [Pseudomonadales bacterium]MBO6655701.1 response regulator [Pseudomonadales bacterium]MBO6702132.1 response regulator [Pseudomonadales bacterium]
MSASESETMEQVKGTEAVNRGRVLVVDDEDYVRSILRGMLEKMGFEAVEAEDGDKGLAAFNAEDGQIVACVIDLTMPGMAGMELLDHIRCLDDKVPVLLVSGYSRHEVRQQEAKSTNISFLQKPFTMEQFQKAMESQLT